MAVPHISGNFADNLDPRFQRIFKDKYTEVPDMIPTLYGMPPHNSRNNMTWSDVGTLPNWSAFNGSVTYTSQAQGFDTTLTWLEFSNGVQVERKLFDDDQHQIFDQKPAALARSAFRTRQTHGARAFVNAFGTDNFFAVNSEGGAMCQDSHTTNSGASTANGFDNLTTASLTATAVQSAVEQMRDFRGDQAEIITVTPDTLLHPPELQEEAFEIIASSGKVDTDINNRDIHEGRYRDLDWEYLTDASDWFLMDSSTAKENMVFVTRVDTEFAMIEDFDTLLAKWRGYMRHGAAWLDWRHILGAQVS